MVKWWVVKWCNGKECQVGEQKIQENIKKHRKAGNTGVAPLFATLVFPFLSFQLNSGWLGSARLSLAWLGSRNRIHPGIILVDPGDAALCHLHRCRSLPPLSPFAIVAIASVGRYRCHLRPLAQLFTVASFDRHCRCRLLLPSPPAAPAATCYCCRLLPLPSPPPASATKNEQIQYL